MTSYCLHHTQRHATQHLLHAMPARLLLASLFACTLPALATPCLYLGTDADTRVMNRSGEISTPYPTALAANDCTRLRVATGNVKVYALKGGTLSPAGNQVSRGQLVPASEGEAPLSADTVGILKQIVLVLEGVNRIKTGSSRSAEVEYLTASLPNGKLSEPTEDLSLELSPTADQNLASFELVVDGKSVFRQTGPAKSLLLPRVALKLGGTVRWKLDYAGKKLDGQFTVEPQARMQAVVGSVQPPQGAGNDAITQALQVAAILTQESFGWDAREMIRKALAGS